MYYSSNGVDALIAPHLPEFGYAVEVGANNGVVASNAKHFEDKGWLVLCVEPNPLLEEEGRRNRKLWRNVACGALDCPEVEFEMVGVYPYASFSGLHPTEAPESLTPGEWKNAVKNTVKLKVPMKCLNSLLVEAGFPRLDLLTVDVEGHELEVLKGVNLDVWRPKIIVAEAWDTASRDRITEHLLRYSYVLDAQREYDYCYGRRIK